MTRLSFIGLVFLSLVGCSQDQSKPAQVDQQTQKPSLPMITSSIPEFNGKDAFGFLLRQTSFGPRNPGSQGHSSCLQYLGSTMRGLADQVGMQEFSHTGYGGEQFRLTNIIASFRPDLTNRILLCAHWDTRPRAEHDENKSRRDQPIIGANDGASGVAVLLEIATLLKKTPPPVGVDLVLFDGEDYGKEGDTERYLLGSRYFASNFDKKTIPRFGILLDMIGDTYLEIPREQNSQRFAPDVMNLVWRTAQDLGVTQFLDAPGEEIMDDHLPLNQAGIKTIDLIDFNYPDQTNRYWHTHQDTPDHCSGESLQAVGSVLMNVLFTQQP
jgi:glutaminyl-peptide cyclotransferase